MIVLVCVLVRIDIAPACVRSFTARYVLAITTSSTYALSKQSNRSSKVPMEKDHRWKVTCICTKVKTYRIQVEWIQSYVKFVLHPLNGYLHDVIQRNTFQDKFRCGCTLTCTNLLQPHLTWPEFHNHPAMYIIQARKSMGIWPHIINPSYKNYQ